MAKRRRHAARIAPWSLLPSDQFSSSRHRLTIFTVLVLSGAAIILARLILLQAVMGDNLRGIASTQGISRITLEPQRGMIYDRTGLPLTENLGDMVSAGAKPSGLESPGKLCRDLADITGKPASYFANRLKIGGDYVLLARKLSPEQAEALKNLGHKLVFQPDPRRVYPYGFSAAQVIGFTDSDNNGISGVEHASNNLLKGSPGWRVVRVDVRGNPHIDTRLPHQPPVENGDVILTIDLSMQSILEDELEGAVKQSNAKGGSGIILNPQTGEILGMVSLPNFNPNYPANFPVINQKSRCFTDIYEPGSTFKVIPAALLLEKRYAVPETEVDCSRGYVIIHNDTIRDVHRNGRLSFEEVIAKSSNVGMIKLTEYVRPTDLYRIISDFGISGRSGLELDGEVRGMVLKPANWSGLTRANMVIGQGVALTALQLAGAYAAIANGGKLMRPMIIHSIRHSDGSIELNESLAIRRCISERTSAILRDFLTEAVERGTGRKAGIDGVTIAGKTGTAQMVNTVSGGYYADRWTSSFVGFFPVSSPQCLILIILEEPRGSSFGGTVAAPVFRAVATRILGLKPELRRADGVYSGAVEWTGNVDKDDVLDQRIEVPNLMFRDLNYIRKDLKKSGLQIVAHGSGSIIYDQAPAAESFLTRNGVIHVAVGPDENVVSGVVIMPILNNLSLRDAVRKATELGLTVDVSGSGKVVKQLPPSGTQLRRGDKCTLFAEV